MRPSVEIKLSGDERSELERLARGRKVCRGLSDQRSTAGPEQAINQYIETVNEDPKPFRWHRTADEILASIKRFCLRTLETAQATAS